MLGHLEARRVQDPASVDDALPDGLLHKHLVNTNLDTILVQTTFSWWMAPFRFDQATT